MNIKHFKEDDAWESDYAIENDIPVWLLLSDHDALMKQAEARIKELEEWQAGLSDRCITHGCQIECRAEEIAELKARLAEYADDDTLKEMEGVIEAQADNYGTLSARYTALEQRLTEVVAALDELLRITKWREADQASIDNAKAKAEAALAKARP